jgi:hypothetical protein
MNATCQNCEKVFIPARPSKRYCSDTCKQMAYYKRLQVKQSSEAPALESATEINKVPEPMKPTIPENPLTEFELVMKELIVKWESIKAIHLSENSKQNTNNQFCSPTDIQIIRFKKAQ